MPIFIAAGIGAAGSLLGGLIGGNAAKSAANTQAQASENAAQVQQNMFNTTVANEAPYRQAGNQAVGTLSGLLSPGGSLNQPFTASMMQQYSPAYQFQLQQGQQGVLNQDSGAQGAESGAALKDLTAYNQGYANTAFNNAFNQYQTQQNNVFNRLSGLATLGQAAASNQATGGSSYANSIGQQISNVGSAQAAGTVGQANAYTGALSGISNNVLLGSLLSQGQTTPTYSNGDVQPIYGGQVVGD